MFLCHFFIDVYMWQFLWRIRQASDSNRSGLTIKVKTEVFMMHSAASLRGLRLERALWNLKWRAERRMILSVWPPGVADIKYINKGIAAMLWLTCVGTAKVSGDQEKYHFTAKYYTFVLHVLHNKPTAYKSAVVHCVAALRQHMCTQNASNITSHGRVNKLEVQWKCE